MLDAAVLHGGPIYEGELAVLIKAHIWGVQWRIWCYDFGPKMSKTQLAAAFFFYLSKRVLCFPFCYDDPLMWSMFVYV